MSFVSKNVTDPTFLNAALEGLELQKQRIEEQIQMVRSMLGKPAGRIAKAGAVAKTVESSVSLSSPAAPKTKRKRVLSPAARKRIAEAQKKRWAEFRKKK